MTETSAWRAGEVFADAGESQGAVPIYLVRPGDDLNALGLDASSLAWLAVQGFKGALKKSVLLPGPDGSLAGVVMGLGEGSAGEPSGPSDLLVGTLAASLPAGTYRLAGTVAAPELAAIAWGLGSYRFTRYRTAASAGGGQVRCLVLPAGVDVKRVTSTVEAIWLARDLINTPASDLGPAELEETARMLAVRHGAAIKVITGGDLLAQNFPMIHAVG
ncbi:MAG: leucyl aminopeptidase family protein, partial [Hyphomicrobium sp.]